MSREKKFTEGPWTINEFSGEIYSKLGRCICSMPFLPNLQGKENRANFNLISAAPELLEVLENIVGFIDKEGPASHEWKAITEWCETAHVAISKAYGESQ
jgi:hypothetical protein